MLLMIALCVCVCVCRMFELKDYTKFVYLDADMLVVGVRVWWCPVARSDLVIIIVHRHSPQDVDELFTYPSFAAAPNFQLKQNRRGINVSRFSDASFNAGECDTATTATTIHS